MSIGVPFHSIAAAAFMKRPRSKARGRSMRGSMAGSSRSNASTSLSQYSRIAARSSADHGPPDRMSARISCFSVMSMPSMPKKVRAPSRPAPFGSGKPFVRARNSVNKSST